MQATTDTAPALPEVTSLPALDKTPVESAAAAAIAGWLAEFPDAETRARKTADLLGRLATQLDKALAKRDAAAWTVETCYRTRRGASIPKALGVGRSRWQRIREEQAKLAPKPVRDAPRKLPGLAAEVARLQAERDVVMAARNAAARELVAGGMSHTAVSVLIGRDRARVSHVASDT